MSSQGPNSESRGSGETLRCDFCGQQTASVRRVALDRGYERLQTPHKELYACAACSREKEQARQGLAPRRR
ncbi:MAG: hypothetical protein CL910_09435 [Deltaproteobacteria bacterium]|nr:hypothetical protein [Deltaproteobacteria bacterium]